MIKQKDKKIFYPFTFKSIIFIFLSLIILIFIMLNIKTNSFNTNSKATYECPKYNNKTRCENNGCKWVVLGRSGGRCIDQTSYETMRNNSLTGYLSIPVKPCYYFNYNKKECQKRSNCYFDRKNKVCLNRY